MRYSLWSHGILVGHTDLDIPTITPTMRQGFIEPTDDGAPALRDATGVNRAINQNRRRRVSRGGEMTDEDMRLFRTACERREALDFELRDESGRLFDCEFIRVWDIQEMSSEIDAHDEVDGEEQDEDDDADIIEDFLGDTDEDDLHDLYQSAWTPEPEPDGRWETMQYHVQVYLKGCFDDIERRAVDLM